MLSGRAIVADVEGTKKMGCMRASPPPSTIHPLMEGEYVRVTLASCSGHPLLLPLVFLKSRVAIKQFTVKFSPPQKAGLASLGVVRPCFFLVTRQ